jgi:hypothetical protein
MQGGEGEGRQSRASSLYDSEGFMPEEKYVSQGLREESCRSSVREKSYREEVGGDRKRARSEQQEVWTRVGQGLEQELESLPWPPAVTPPGSSSLPDPKLPPARSSWTWWSSCRPATSPWPR